MGDQVPFFPPSMTGGEIREAFLSLYQAMTSKSNAFTSQVQAMMAQVNREVRPRVPHHVNNMAYHLRDFTRMNPHIFFGSKVDEDPQDFVDEVYKIFDALVMTSIEKVELASYQLKDVSQTWYLQWRDNRALRCGPVTW